jgi:hypothetical protein
MLLEPHPLFTARPSLLKLLEEHLQVHAHDENSRRALVLWGLGGVGKTELILRFVEIHRHLYSHTFWVDSSSVTQMIKGYETIARLAGIPIKINILRAEDPLASKRMIQQVKIWLSMDESGHWLMIFDNLNDEDVINALQSIL